MLGLFSLTFLSILFWCIPWLPYGLSVDDYDTRFTLLMSLVMIAGLTAFGAVYHRDLGRRLEQTLLTWSSVYDGLGGLRRREYFYDRILIECERAQHSSSQFTIVTLRTADVIRTTEEGALEGAIKLLSPFVRESDCLAILGSREIGVLALGVDGRMATSYAEKLTELLNNSQTGTTKWASAGWSVYGVDSVDAGTLIGIARQRSGKVIPMHSTQKPADDGDKVDYDSAIA
jgi:GGDEF domain-containing protein